MAEERYNFATWRPEVAGDKPAARQPLNLDGVFVLSAGMEPNVNTAVVSDAQLQQIQTLGQWTGTVEFWYAENPFDPFKPNARPDSAWEKITIVDAEPVMIGMKAGEKQASAIQWRIYLADARHRLIFPRGGRLDKGIINPDAADLPPLAPGQAAPPVVGNAQIIAWCLQAMGQGDGDRSTWYSFDDLPPLRNLKWMGNHAPGELAKVLDALGGTLLVYTDGTLLVTLAQADDPNQPSQNPPPADRLIMDIPTPTLERRGKTVIFTSAPTPVCETIHLGANRLRFVIRNSKGQWTPLADSPDVLLGAAGTPVAGVWLPPALAFAKPDWIDPKFQEQVFNDLFHVIALRDDSYQPLMSPILRKTFVNGDWIHGIDVEADVVGSDGYGFRNHDGVKCTADTLLQGNIVHVQNLLARFRDGEWHPSLGTPYVDLAINPSGMTHNNYIDYDIDHVRVTLTVARATAGPAPDQPGKIEFFNCGFMMGPAGIVQLADADVLNALDHPTADIVIIPRPEMRLILNGDAANDADARQRLVDECKALAARFLAGSGGPPRIVRVKGFWNRWLDGTTNEVRFDQENLTTTYQINRWYVPTNVRARQLLSNQLGAAAFPKQADQSAPKTNLGEPGHVQPVVQLVAASPPAAAVLPNGLVRWVWLEKDGGDDGDATKAPSYTYRVTSADGIVLSEKVSLEGGRAVGSFNSATIGMMSSGEAGPARLLWCNEIEKVGPCTTTGGA